MIRSSLFLGLVLAFTQPAAADIRYTLSGENDIAQVGELSVSRPLLDILLTQQKKAAAHSGKPATLQMILQQVIDDALMAEHARKTMSEEQLLPAVRVEFPWDVVHQRGLVSLLRNHYDQQILAAVAALPGGSFASLVEWNPQLNEALLKEKFALQPGLNIAYTEEQLELAKNTPVLTLTLDGKRQDISLFDIYRRQNVQGRLSLLSADLAFLKDQTRQYVGSLYVLHWSERTLGEKDFATLNQIITNKQQHQQLLRHLGMNADIHDDNPALRAKAATITDEQLQQAYTEHKEDFRVVEKARVRHIRLNDQQQADKVVEEIRQGLPFDKAVERYSVAADKASGGELGWLNRADEKRSWLHSIAFIQPQGVVSPAFRSPQNEGDIVFEILWVDERVEGYLPLSDKGVRYELAHTMAMEQIMHSVADLQQQLRKDSDIYLNQRLQANRS
ncbi:peptidylprolyl isomerase [Thalassolituus marinus]|uniref:peptidylprolyl isomerase n=1 Tax=Thalassolituus marinus TaxID=671053 RepID=A0ABS7ZNR4_9GAMM|nr:peptidylprolyl isomerase [Thalassolituus marinus]MCA6063355.1 peptidylprolyl isomerase [Thalassolituus marinus]